MLERNRRVPVTVDPNTVIAYTPETGSVVGGQSTITGNNSPISFRNLEITGSINFLSVTGSTGGTLNRYNGEVTQSFYMTGSLGTGINPLVAIEPEYQKVFDDNIGAVRRHLSGSWTFNRTLDTIDFTAPFKGRFSFYSLEGDVFGSFIIPDPQLRFLFSSSIRGNVYEQVVTSESLSQLENIYTDFIKFTPEEKFTLWVRGEDQSGTPTSIGDAGRISMSLLDVDFYGLGDGIKPYSSSIHNSYVTQSWIVKNATISGSAYEIHDYQDEFFNGEFSGSEFIATTQSLLYNPYAPSQTLNTSYKIAISTSLGQWTSGVGTSEAISTYPSYSIEMDVKAFPIGGPGEDELNEMIEDFTGAALDYNKGFIILYQDKTDPSQFFIYAIGFPAISAPIGDPTPSSTSRTVLGFNGSNNWIGGISDIPLPPVSASGFDGGLYTGSNDTPAYQYNNIGPYFKLDISGSILPTATTTAFTSLEFVTDSLAGGLSSSIVISPLLGNSTNIQKYATQYATGAGGTQMLVYKFPQAINASTKKIYRPIRFNGTPDRGGLPDMSNVFVTGSGGVPTYVTMSVYYSNFDLAYNGVEGPFGKSWLTNASDPGFEAASPGSGSMLLQGLTWTGSFGDSGYYAPYGLVFTKYSVDEFGNLINNSETIVQNPNFDFDTTNYQGVTASIDDYGLRGGQFRQNLAVVDSILSFPRGEDILTGLGYKYDPINSRPLSGSPYKASGLPVQYLPTRSQDLQFINFNPQLPAFIDFYNTPYNSLINNVTQSVPNTYLQVVEYEGGSSTGSSGVPSNIIPITNNTAEKARIPDSFYTQKASITPRYFGSKLQSANYNSFTPSGSSIVNLNAFLLSSSNSQSFTGYRTGSIWGGDALPGTMRSTNTPLSTVFKAPIYFAHYKSSKNNQDLQGTYTFDIDALIQVPLEDITGDKAPELPVIIKVDGSNENLTNVRSTFEVDRKALVSYNTAQQFISGSGKTIKYDTLPVGSNRIYQGGMEYQYIGTNKLLGGYLINNTNLTTSFQPYGTYASTQSFFTSSLFEGFVTTRFGVGGNASDIFTDGSYSSYLSQGSSPNSGSLNYSGSGREYWMSTSSLGGFNENEGVLFLEGGPATISASLGSFGRNTYTGPSLALFHTANIWVSNSIIASNNTTNPGIPDNVTIDPTDPSYYFRFNFVSSSMQSYDDFELPFIIKQGDEISVTYNVGPEQAPTIVTQDFNVIEVRSRATRTGTITSDQIVYGNPVLPGTLNKVSKNRIYDQLVVYPDPTTIPNPIPNGHIWNFAIRRRVNADDRVIIFQTPPRNAEGAATPSPSGYLIPADMTPIQKRNVQSLITQLNAKNAFPSDQADNEPIRGEGF